MILLILLLTGTPVVKSFSETDFCIEVVEHMDKNIYHVLYDDGDGKYLIFFAHVSFAFVCDDLYLCMVICVTHTGMHVHE